MRNMSFFLTTEQARNKSKRVTRRLGWANLKPGERVQQVVKGQGLKKGEHPEKIHQIEIISNVPQPLDCMLYEPYGKPECRREGFPGMTGAEFVEMFCAHNGCDPTAIVNVIAFEYV